MKYSEGVANKKDNLKVEKGDVAFIDCVHYLPFWGGVCKLRPFHTNEPLHYQLCEVVYGKFRDIEQLDKECKERKPLC